MQNPINAYTQVTVRGKTAGGENWEVILPFNIPWTPNRVRARNHPQVIRCIAAIAKRYAVVDVTYRDMDV